ncbi:hypothetical protein PHYSODRAFT_480336 [Phytophthora sojae]|uniref:Uncharacterized protein n=1 Tax=Phytophthora sojae (strain P6497) TaxID=1094619 RepID=G4YR71_PHYSP|nr:hypothetical protein PHYSODRAFT_480336 [Phytophthora sojae]EGZ22805.1 hypothetical protein PHYSODRAFT_480336 [Phytophthora sojae]|eukprot:XP_009518093.1 hypothetical protein PHYSODRAFT_480336 [Phytophthora sojae]
MTSPLPACAGVFMRAHCPHARLFEEEYKRYCGSPLEVVLRFGDESDVAQAVDQDTRALAAPFDVANVFVFARFETVEGKPLSGAHSLRYMRSVSQSEVNPEASWIEGVRQTAADRQQYSQQLHGRQLASRLSSSRESARPDSATFVLNGQAFAKWYYHWESGANKVQRATKHALKAYVFYQTQEAATTGLQQQRQQHQASAGAHQGSTGADGTLELLCVVTSPPFTVVSYRRAPLEAAAGGPGALGLGGIDAATSLMPHYATDTAHPVDARLRRIVQHQISRAFREYNQQQRQSEPRGSSDDLFAQVGTSRLQDEQKEEEDRSGSEERDSFDRYRHLQEREGLRFRLLTPEDAALSGSALHSQIEPREPRLVFDSTRRRDGGQHWRDRHGDVSRHGGDNAFGDDYDDDDIRDEAVPQPLAPGSWSALGASGYECKAAGPVGMPPSTTDPVRQAEKAARVAIQRFKQQQHQLNSHQRELHQLTDLAIIHFFVSRVTTSSARSLANLEVVLTIAISQHWRYASGGATHLARLILALSSGAVDGASVSRGTSGGSFAETKCEELMLVLGEVCVWAFSPENLGLVQSLLSACHPLLLENLRLSTSGGVEDGGKELRTAFLECVGRCWSALDEFLQTPRATQTTIRSARELSDAVLGVVYSDPELADLRCGLRAMLQRPTIVLEDSKENGTASSDGYESGIPRLNLAGWQGFVAQVREGYLIQAEPSVLAADNAWLRLICDGRVRVAPVAPNGLTSLMGGASNSFGGDYVAYRLEHRASTNAAEDGGRLTTIQAPDNASDHSSICVEFYWWPLQQEQAQEQDQLLAFRSVTTLKIATSGTFMEGRMELECGFVKREGFTAAESSRLELWAPTERVQAVAGWAPWLSIEGVYARK